MPDTPNQILPEKKNIAGFEIIEKIGEGGMGAVYRARQISLNRIVAVKVLTPRLSSDTAYIESFRREAQAAARLQHPNIISVFSAGEASGTYYYAMEYVRGRTLFSWIKKEGALPETTVVEIAVCVANALRFAWEKEKLIHRDVKPENIMVDTDGNVKLCDLGLAKVAGESSTKTQAGQLFGTPHYASPEQAAGEPMIDQRSDIYSLGMSIYHVLTGEVPFRGDSPVVVMAKHLTDQLSDPRDIVPHVSANICRVLEKMLSKTPSDRYTRWDDVLADLELIHNGRPPRCTKPARSSLRLRRTVASPPPAPAAVPLPPTIDALPPTIDAPRQETAKGSKATVIIISIFGVIIVAALVALFLQPPPKKKNPRDKPAPEVVITPQATQKWAELKTFAAANPAAQGELVERLRAFAREFPNTSEAAEAQRMIEGVTGRMNAAKRFTEIQAFIQANPTASGQIGERLRAFLKEFPNVPETTPAQRLLDTLPVQTVAAPGKAITNSIGMQLVQLPAGEFDMGSDQGDADEKPLHRVRITKSFYIGKYEVTQEEFQAVTKRNLSTFKGSGRLPVENVTWEQAVEFCRLLSAKEGKQYRLPTEAEWEYACRAGTMGKFYSGEGEDDLKRAAWFNQNGEGKTHEVGQKEANKFGLHDTLGNVWEWVSDWYSKDYYANSSPNDPTGPERGQRLMRGGSCLSGSNAVRASYRLSPRAGQPLTAVGFRVVRVE